MNKVIFMAMIFIAAHVLSACSSEEAIEEEVSLVSNEGPYGGHSVQWYKAHWKTKTAEQRKWCRLQQEDVTHVQSCINANEGWKQGWADPKTNPPRRWEDGPSIDRP